MHNKNEIRAPRSGPKGFGGPGGSRMGVGEKAKNFKSAIIRLFKELKGFWLGIIIALLLALLGACLSVNAPNKLSKLTDEISLGLVINKSNIEELSSKITSNIKSDETKNKKSELLQ